ncbi:MAG: pilus assembly protein TadG-related protein [Bacillota bacterium]
MQKNCLKDESGEALILVTVLMVVVFAFAALVVDVGMLYAERRSMVTAADAATLAGAKELALTGDPDAAVAVARAYAEANGAEITGEISVETVVSGNQTFQAVVVNAGRNKEFFFAKLLGFTDQDVMARSTAVWGYPTRYRNILPIFYIVVEGEGLPEGEVVLLNKNDTDEFAPGNWGLLRADSPGKKTINEILAGAASDLWFQTGYDITNDTETGDPMSRIGAVEARMQAARQPDSRVSMEGVIPIIREITGQGHTSVVIVGFAPYVILDVITEITKEEDNRWYGRGSPYAHHLQSPKLYSVYEDGYDKKKEVDEDYPKGTIIGRFLQGKFISPYDLADISQNPEHDFGLIVVKLVD